MDGGNIKAVPFKSKTYSTLRIGIKIQLTR